MHWKPWDILCFKKKKGGLGFKDLPNFNTSILGKQFWHLIENPNYLFSRVSKDNLHPWNRLFHTLSCGWCSIVSGRSLISKWLIKRVRLWSSISVWNNNWLTTTHPRPATSNQENLYPNVTVDSLINSTSRTWNSQVIQSLVDPEDAKIIESIPLSNHRMLDHDEWHFTTNRKYTVKSGYQVKRIYPDIEASKWVKQLKPNHAQMVLSLHASWINPIH